MEHELFFVLISSIPLGLQDEYPLYIEVISVLVSVLFQIAISSNEPSNIPETV